MISSRLAIEAIGCSVAPMASTEAVTLPMREDVVTEGGDPAKVLANAPRTDRNFFVVPKVVE